MLLWLINRMTKFILSTVIFSSQVKKLISAELEVGHWNARKITDFECFFPNTTKHAHTHTEPGLAANAQPLQHPQQSPRGTQNGAQQPPSLNPISKRQQCHHILLTVLL